MITNFEVSQAERIKLVREKKPWGYPPQHGEPSVYLGAKPLSHPIRKKAWHRALKRGALWAVVPYKHMQEEGVCLNMGPNKFARIIPDRNCPENQAFIMWPWTNDTYT